MVVAVIVALLAFVAVVALIALVVYLRGRSKHASAASKGQPHAITSVGVASSMADGADAAHAQHVSTRPAATQPSEELRSRFAALGVFAAGVFGALGVKLFALQVVNHESYASQAEQNTYASVTTPAPRGIIYDVDGRALVKNRTSLTVLADSDVADDHDVVARLSALLGVPYNVVRQRIEDSSSGAQSLRVVASDVRLRDVAFISEHSDAFGDVSVQSRSVREYPYGALAAHVLGYTGTVSEDELEAETAGREIESDDEVGKTGVEEYYDSLLAGTHGVQEVVADADGDVVEVVSETDPTRGSDLTLTIAAPVQYVADEALADLIAPTGVIGSGSGVGGAIVVMDVTDGSILAMASYPTYAPEKFIGGISQDAWELYSDEGAYNPLLNRAIAGTYPPASTFKAFSGLAALEYGYATTEDSWHCTGSWDGWNTGSPQNCWNHYGHGYLGFREGIVVSCDVVFYEIGRSFWNGSETNGTGEVSDTALQDYVMKFGFGSTSGIDLSGEAEGRVPTPEWKEEYYSNQPENGQWQGGDYTNMCIGQGYMLATPLQLAVAYGGVATGSLCVPHVLKSVSNADGDEVAAYEPQVTPVEGLTEEHLETVRDALRGVATDNSTVAALLSEAGVSNAACKTGTAEYTDEEDTAWFVCYAPYDDPKYVVATVVEHGGGGSSVAGPVGAQVLAAALAYADGELTEVGSLEGSSGESTDTAGEASGTSRTD